MLKKRNILLFLILAFGLAIFPSQQAHAAYTNSGWVWTDSNHYDGYGTVNPSGNIYANGISGVPVKLKAGTTPTTTFTYTPADASKDPWYGGDIKVTWSGTVSASINFFNIIGQIGNGLGFVAHVNLPDSIYSGDVQQSIKNATEKPQIMIGKTPVTLDASNFVPIGPHTLRLTVTKNNVSGISGTLIAIATSGVDLNNLPISFSIKVPISSITANGAYDVADSTKDKPVYYNDSRKLLTTNRFPPMQNKTDDFSVDFYGSDDIQEGGSKGLFGIVSGTGYYYAKLNSDNTFIPKNRVYSTIPIKSWNQYISPSDKTGYYNTATTGETVDGSNKQISDFSFTSNYLRNYNLNLDVYNGNWDQINKSNPTRFDRIVNFFTQKSTSGGNLNHSPTTGGSIGSSLPVQYTGNDSDGTPLSPVQVNVSEKYQASDIKINNVTTYGEFTSGTVPTGVQSGTESKINISWKAPSLRSGKIVYQITDALWQNNVAETTFVSKITNTADTLNNYQTATGYIPALKPGNYLIQFKIVDDDYPNQNDWTSSDNSAYVVALDTPKFEVSNSITNERTSSTDGQEIDALWGDTIDEDDKYSVASTGQNKIDNPVLTITTPKNTSYSANSLVVKVNGSPINLTNVDYSKISSGMQVDLNNITFKTGDTIDVAYKYVVNNVSNQIITTVPVSLSASAQFIDANGKASTTSILPITSKEMNIKLPAEGLQFISAPSTLSFGMVNRPYQTTDFPIVSKNLNFVISNTLVGVKNSGWQLSATLSQEFHTSSGKTLNSEFANITYSDGTVDRTIRSGQVTPIYSGSGKGTQTFNLDNKFKLHVDPVGISDGLTNNNYNSQVTWNLTNGPTN